MELDSFFNDEHYLLHHVHVFKKIIMCGFWWPSCSTCRSFKKESACHKDSQASCFVLSGVHFCFGIVRFLSTLWIPHVGIYWWLLEFMAPWTEHWSIYLFFRDHVCSQNRECEIEGDYPETWFTVIKM